MDLYFSLFGFVPAPLLLSWMDEVYGLNLQLCLIIYEVCHVLYFNSEYVSWL